MPDAAVFDASRILAYLGSILRVRREACGLTQKQASLLIPGLSRSTLSELETGKHTLRLEKILEYAHALGVRFQDLFPEDPDAPLTEIVTLLYALPPEQTPLILHLLRMNYRLYRHELAGTQGCPLHRLTTP